MGKNWINELTNFRWKRKLSLDDGKNSFRKKIREETNFPNSSSEVNSEYKTHVDLTSSNKRKRDTTIKICQNFILKIYLSAIW